jgi:seryl-tRNA synthetase
MINYALLANAMAYFSAQYTNCGFARIEVPWSVKAKALRITAPPGVDWYRHQDGKYLVASGEQSFLQLMLDKALPPGRYCCLTPCFRGDEEDLLHKHYFMKVELINTLKPDATAVQEMIAAAKWFFEHSVKISCRVVDTVPEEWDEVNVGKTFDIVDTKHEIELGSYGIREHSSVGRWAYGTGIAEPRASTVAALLLNPASQARTHDQL